MLLSFLSLALLAQTGAGENIVTLQPDAEAGFERLHIELSFTGESDGTTEIIFPERWGPVDDLARFRSAITFANEDGELTVAESVPGQFTLTHQPGATLSVRYSILPHDGGDPRWAELPIPGMWPDLSSNHAVVIGYTILPGLPGVEGAFRLAIEGLEPGQISQASLDLDVLGRSEFSALGDIAASVIFLGAVRQSEDNRDGLSIRFVAHGDWEMSDTEFMDVTRTTISTAGELFNDNAFDDYLIALNAMPPLEAGSAIAGTALHNSFYLFATPNAGSPELTYTIVHEVLHEWITLRMGQTDDTSFTNRMWFAEGFTDYFTHLIMLEAGYYSLSDYLDAVNQMALDYQQSPVNTVPVSDLMSVLMTSYEASRLPYQRGSFLAMHWDYRLRHEHGRSLADIVSSFIERAQNIEAQGEAATLTDEAIYSVLEDALGEDFTSLHASVLERGEVFDLSTLSLPDCLQTTENDQGLTILAVVDGADMDACREALLAH